MADADEQQFLAAPPVEAVRKAVADAEEAAGGRSSLLNKVIYLDEQGQTVGESKQIPEDPFAGRMTDGLQDPPYSLEQLVYLAETHPVHSAALEQKATDIVGKGWTWEPQDEDNADEDVRDKIAEWFDSLAPDDISLHEVIHSAEDDLDTTGWGLIEVTRNADGTVAHLYHVPAHTVRAHKNGYLLCQIRNGKKVWFARWGAKDKNGEQVQVDSKTGSMKVINDKGTELFVIKRQSRRSSWYGIPGYVSAIGWITLALACRDDNLLYFHNRREPRWAILMYNLSDTPGTEEDIRRAFVVDLKQPHRNILIPLTGNAKVEFKELSQTAKDGSFDKLSERADREIMIAHRVPGERLANSRIGPLGGDSTLAASRIYKDGVVAPGQQLLDNRLNRFIEVEYPPANGDPSAATDGLGWTLKMEDLDLDDEKEDLDLVVISFKADLITLGEARARLSLGPLMKPVLGPTDPETGVAEPERDSEGNPVEEESPFNGMLYTQLPGVAKGIGGSSTGGPDSPPELTDAALKGWSADVRELLWQTRETHDRIAELPSELPSAA